MDETSDKDQDLSPLGAAACDPSPVPAEPIPSHPVPPRPPLSPVGTALSALVLFAALLLFAWLQVSVPPLDRVASPERALELMVGRSLDLEEAFAALPSWQRFLVELSLSDSGDTLAEALAWYEELAAAQPDNPLVQAYLAILEGEAGRREPLGAKLAQWASAPAPLPVFGRLLGAAYFATRLTPEAGRALQAELADHLPDGWFHDRLAARLATLAGDPLLLGATREAQAGRSAPLLQRVRLLAGAQLLGLLAGLLLLLAMFRRQQAPETFRIGPATVPPPWPGGLGKAVLLRGGALSALLVIGLLSVEQDDLLLRSLVIPLTNLPIVFLAWRHLLAPLGLGLAEAFGLRPLPGRTGRLAAMTLVMLAVGLSGEWLLGQLADALALRSHWTEWFDGDLVWGSGPVVAVSLVEYVVFAPLFEELVFRGLLFATLRRRLPFGAAALLSGAIFALAHGYGLLGTASVLWSGVVWAWVYEKTGSLLPGLLAHALNNLTVCLTILLLLR